MQATPGRTCRCPNMCKTAKMAVMTKDSNLLALSAWTHCSILFNSLSQR